MATARSLQGIEWLARTYANAILIAAGKSAEASTLRGNLTINSNARLNALITRGRTYEAALWAEYQGWWDDGWQSAVDKIKAEVIAQCPIPLDEMLGDSDANVKIAIKLLFRVVELRACEFIANGGNF